MGRIWRAGIDSNEFYWKRACAVFWKNRRQLMARSIAGRAEQSRAAGIAFVFSPKATALACSIYSKLRNGE